MKNIILIAVFLWSCANVALAQEEKALETPQAAKDTTITAELPKFDVHLAIGLIGGLRVGARYQFLEHFSTEVAYGTSFCPVCDGYVNYSIGLNLHEGNIPLSLGLIITYSEAIIILPRYLYISPTIEFLTLKSSGFHLFGGIGPSVRIPVYDTPNPHNKVVLNLDLGVSFSFP